MCSEVHYRLVKSITWRGATRTRSTKMELQLFKFLVEQGRNWFLRDCDIERPVDRGFEVCDWFHGLLQRAHAKVASRHVNQVGFWLPCHIKLEAQFHSPGFRRGESCIVERVAAHDKYIAYLCELCVGERRLPVKRRSE